MSGASGIVACVTFKEDRLRRQSLSWCVYAIVIVIGVLTFYGSGWRQEWHVANPWFLRMIAIAAILIVSVLAALIARLLPDSVRLARAIIAGLLTGLTLHYLAGWVGDYYLGGNAHSDQYDLGRLMSEGYGMGMYIAVTPAIGILAWIRAEIAWWGS